MTPDVSYMNLQGLLDRPNTFAYIANFGTFLSALKSGTKGRCYFALSLKPQSRPTKAAESLETVVLPEVWNFLENGLDFETK